MASSVDPLYDLFMNKGLVPREIVTTGINAMICCVGIGLNSSLVYVTIKTKSLHSPCIILVAFYAFFASFLLFGSCVKFVIFAFGINYITLRTCLYIQIVPIIGTAIALTLQLCTGLDRLIGVIFPFWYNSNGKNVSFKFAIAVCCIKSILNGFSAYIGSSTHWEKPVMCTLGDPSNQPENQYFTNIGAIVMYCGEFLCYTLILLIILRQKSLSFYIILFNKYFPFCICPAKCEKVNNFAECSDVDWSDMLHIGWLAALRFSTFAMPNIAALFAHNLVIKQTKSQLYNN